LLFVGLAEHAELDAARKSLVAAGCDRDDHVVLHAVVELAVLKTRLADALEPPTNARRSAPDALPADLDDTVLGEEVHDVVPHLAVRVIAVGGLEISNAVFVVQRVDAVLQLLERRFGFGGRTGRRRDRNA